MARLSLTGILVILYSFYTLYESYDKHIHKITVNHVQELKQ